MSPSHRSRRRSRPALGVGGGDSGKTNPRSASRIIAICSFPWLAVRRSCSQLPIKEKHKQKNNSKNNTKKNEPKGSDHKNSCYFRGHFSSPNDLRREVIFGGQPRKQHPDKRLDFYLSNPPLIRIYSEAKDQPKKRILSKHNYTRSTSYHHRL